MKHIISICAFLFMMLPAAIAGNSGTDTQNSDDAKWQTRKRYINLSYGIQKQSNDAGNTFKSDAAFSFAMGRTFYLHKKPIAGMIKFGLDWTYADLNFAKYPKLETVAGNNPDYDDEPELDVAPMQLDAGMGVGPSITVNPVSQLRINAYGHITPSYSVIFQDQTLYNNYTTFFNAGLAVSYKVISIGIENRWNARTNYGGFDFGNPNYDEDGDYDDDGSFDDLYTKTNSKIKTNTLRFFISFRF